MLRFVGIHIFQFIMAMMWVNFMLVTGTLIGPILAIILFVLCCIPSADLARRFWVEERRKVKEVHSNFPSEFSTTLFAVSFAVSGLFFFITKDLIESRTEIVDWELRSSRTLFREKERSDREARFDVVAKDSIAKMDQVRSEASMNGHLVLRRIAYHSDYWVDSNPYWFQSFVDHPFIDPGSKIQVKIVVPKNASIHVGDIIQVQATLTYLRREEVRVNPLTKMRSGLSIAHFRFVSNQEREISLIPSYSKNPHQYTTSQQDAIFALDTGNPEVGKTYLFDFRVESLISEQLGDKGIVLEYSADITSELEFSARRAYLDHEGKEVDYNYFVADLIIVAKPA